MKTCAASAWTPSSTVCCWSVVTWSPAPNVESGWVSVPYVGSTLCGPCMSSSLKTGCCGSSPELMSLRVKVRRMTSRGAIDCHVRVHLCCSNADCCLWPFIVCFLPLTNSSTLHQPKWDASLCYKHSRPLVITSSSLFTSSWTVAQSFRYLKYGVCWRK